MTYLVIGVGVLVAIPLAFVLIEHGLWLWARRRAEQEWWRA